MTVASATPTMKRVKFLHTQAYYFCYNFANHSPGWEIGNHLEVSDGLTFSLTFSLEVLGREEASRLPSTSDVGQRYVIPKVFAAAQLIVMPMKLEWLHFFHRGAIFRFS